MAPVKGSAKLYPIIKWAGGKENELKYIIPNLPKFENYFEPFVGGGSVYTAIGPNKCYINDKSEELISLYRFIASEDECFYQVLDEIIHNWAILTEVPLRNSAFFLNTYRAFAEGKINDDNLLNIIYEFILQNSSQFNGMFSKSFNVDIEHFIKEIKKTLIRKIHRMRTIESQKGKMNDRDILDNIETAFKSSFYMHLRYIYNNVVKYRISESFRISIFFFIRNYAYSGMFRYNKKGEFNVPYGGIAYNRNTLSKKVIYLRSQNLKIHMQNTVLECLDFHDFFQKHKPREDDFVFLDPPYDSDFSTYAQNKFGLQDQQRLAQFLIQECKAKWMMIIKNTEFVYNLYCDNGLRIRKFDKKYLVSFMNRNDKEVEHLLITNY